MQLVLCGAYGRGRRRREPSDEQLKEAELLQSLVRVGWGRDDPVFRRVFTSRFLPEGTPEQMAWFDELQRVSVSAETAWRLRELWSRIDVEQLLDQVAAPTLVAHARGDAVVPFEEGRRLAAGIPGARFVPLDSRNHVLLESEPAWQAFLAELRAFIGGPPGRVDAVSELSRRELEVLRLVADGLSNDEIAERLFLSVRTVERHLSNAYAKLRVSGKSARAAAAARVAQLDDAPSAG